MTNKLKRRPKVYLSGPISKGGKVENFKRFIAAQKRLIDAGFAVLNPGLSMAPEIADHCDHATWLENDLPWVEAADLLVRLPGESVGADMEVKAAIAAGVEVVTPYNVAGLKISAVQKDPVAAACCWIKYGLLWCQGSNTCPDECRHRWPEAFPAIEWTDVLNDVDNLVTAADMLRDIAEDFYENGDVDFAQDLHEIANGITEETAREDTEELELQASKNGKMNGTPVIKRLSWEAACECPPNCDACESIGSDCGGDETTDRLASIMAERQKVYGDPKENHEGIAMMWAPLLSPHAEAIGRQEPIPAHVVALMMCALKLDRMRLTYHADNYDDAHNYLSIAQDLQSSKGGAA